MRTGFEISIDESLKKQMKSVPLPEGVTWSHVFRVLFVSALSDKKGESQAEFMKRLLNLERGAEVYNWIRGVMRERGEL